MSVSILLSLLLAANVYADMTKQEAQQEIAKLVQESRKGLAACDKFRAEVFPLLGEEGKERQAALKNRADYDKLFALFKSYPGNNEAYSKANQAHKNFLYKFGGLDAKGASVFFVACSSAYFQEAGSKLARSVESLHLSSSERNDLRETVLGLLQREAASVYSSVDLIVLQILLADLMEAKLFTPSDAIFAGLVQLRIKVRELNSEIRLRVKSKKPSGPATHLHELESLEAYQVAFQAYLGRLR